MKGIFYTMQGGYGYIVILEILVVCGLSLGLVYLLMRRLLEQTALAEGLDLAARQQESDQVDSAVLDQANARAEAAQHELEKMAELRKKSDEKVKFLESKLLEYEILQEEIGTLSALKLENEQLRDTVARLEGEPGARTAAESDRAQEKDSEHLAEEGSIGDDPKLSDAATTPAITASESEDATASDALITNEDLARLAEKAQTEKSGGTAPAAEIPGASKETQPDASEDSAPQSQDGIDKLIAQIDELTSEGTEDKKKKTGS